jgi:hypothetical protein
VEVDVSAAFTGARVPAEEPIEIVPSRDFPPLFAAIDEIGGAVVGQGSDTNNTGDDRGGAMMDEEKTDPGMMPAEKPMGGEGGAPSEGGGDAKAELASMLGASPEQIDMMLKEAKIDAATLLDALKQNPKMVDELKQAMAGSPMMAKKPKAAIY